MRDFNIPKNSTDVKSFFGINRILPTIHPQFSKLTKLLTDLTKRYTIPLDRLSTNSFRQFETKLCEEPIFKYSDFTKHFTYTTDASHEGLGAIFSRDEHPCCYISRTLNALGRNYSTTEEELLAVVSVRTTFHRSSAPKWLQNVKEIYTNEMEIEEYENDIEYTRGKDNTAAGALSRVYITQKITMIYCLNLGTQKNLKFPQTTITKHQAQATCSTNFKNGKPIRQDTR